MSSLSVTASRRPAGDRVVGRLEAAARDFGLGGIGLPIEALVRASLEQAQGDLSLASNRLQPGGLPFEWSFAASDPEALRFELQPFDPALEPGLRIEHSADLLSTMISDQYSDELAACFRETVEGAIPGPGPALEFGAFAGFVLHPRRRPELKLYVESGPGFDDLAVAGSTLLFRSVSAGEAGLCGRDYHLCGDGLRLMDLEGICERLGIGHRLPALAVAVLDMTGRDFHLPPRSALLGIRNRDSFGEHKVELLVVDAVEREGLAWRIEQLLAPEAIRPFRKWSSLAAPAASIEDLIRVVSLRASRNQPISVSVYAAEKGTMR